MSYIYKGVRFDDHGQSKDDGYDSNWSQICTACAHEHGLYTEAAKHDCPAALICGVEGCNNEADFYLDFDGTEIIPIKIKCYVVCHRVGCAMNSPEIFPSYEKAFEYMSSEHTAALAGYNEDDYYKSCTGVDINEAIIATGGDWEEWTISRKELEITDLHDLASMFLAMYRGQVGQLSQKTPQALVMKAALTEQLDNMKRLLPALPAKIQYESDGDGDV